MRHFKRIFLFTGLWISFSFLSAKAQTAPLPSSALIENALQKGIISQDKAQIYNAYLSFSPEKLPKEFRSDTPEKCGTSLRKQALSYLSKLDAASRKKFNAPMPVPPYDSLPLPADFGLTQTYETQNFMVWYTTTGSNAPPTADSDSSGIPDYIENAGKYAEETLAHQVNTLGYKKPPITTIPKYYLYIATYASGVYGVTFYGHFPGNSGNQIDALFIIHNNFSFARTNEDPDGTVLGALKVTIAHELFHGVQAAYDWFEDEEGCSGISPSCYWFAEASAVWMEDEVYPNTNDYIGYLTAWFSANGVPLDSSSILHQYGSVIFAKFLSEKVAGADGKANPVIIKDIWEETVNTINAATQRGGRSLDAIKTVLQAKYAATLPVELKNFYVTNYLKNYVDGAKFPGVRCTDYSSTNVNFSQTSLNRLSATYYCYASSIQKPLAISFNGSDDAVWRVALVKEATSSKSTEDLSLNTATQDGYSLISTFGGAETKVAAVLVNATETGTGKYDYQSAVGGFGTNPNLTPPSNLQVSYSSGKTALSWDAGGGALTGYKVYRSTASGSGYTLLATLGNKTSYDDVFFLKAKPSGQTSFYYIVTSYNDAGESFPSKEKESAVAIPVTSLKVYNAPNPFSTKTTLYVTYPPEKDPLAASLEIYNILGKRIYNTYVTASQVENNKKSNLYVLPLDGINLASGVYIYRLSLMFNSTTSSAIGKFVVIR